MKKMNSKVKKQWLAALRSGKYKQGAGFLCRLVESDETPKFCCLGVLCDLYIKENPNKAKWVAETEYKEGFPVKIRSFCSIKKKNDVAESGLLPPEVAVWAGFRDEEGFLDEGDVQYKKESKTFPELNDDVRLSFKQIANIVDKQL